MFMLQLFDADDAAPIDARLLRDGIMRIGRDHGADWPIADPECAISRAHCELIVGDDGLSLRSLGANGVFDDASGSRFPDAIEVPIVPPIAVRMGRFRIDIGHAPHDDVVEDSGRTMILTPPLGASTEVPSDWSDPAPAAAFAQGSLFEAFCEGAGLDASRLSDEPPEVILKRAGAVYRQMVLGVGDLMAERDKARATFRLTRTTISGAGNNPFKWAPTQRLAIDLLLAGSDSFLSGPTAIKASFEDIKRHLVATFAGFQGSLRTAVETFEPKAIEEQVGHRVTLLKSRHAVQAQEVAERHADLSRQLNAGEEGSLNRAFVAAYDAADSRMGRGGR